MKHGRVQFGVYELDPEGLELRKHGLPIRLQDQPLQVLTALVERPGEIVTREQLRERIWGRDTFVDFDQSLNKAVNRLREALNDDPAQPRYVERVPRRGYRFVAPVTATTVHSEIEVPRPPEQVNSEKNLRWRLTSSRIAIGSVTAAGMLAIMAALLWSHRSTAPILQEPRHMSSSSFMPSLSSDGRLLAYASAPDGGTPHIWIQQASGGEATQLTNGPEFDVAPDFSPDGSQIVFCSERQGGGIYVVPSLSGAVKLVVAGYNSCFPRFSPNGGEIVYSTEYGIFTVSANGGEPVGLPINREFKEFGQRAFWSPSGKEILFYGAKKEPQNQPGQWWITPVNEARPTLARIPGVDNDNLWGWTLMGKAGEWIVYSTTTQDTWKLWRVAVVSGAIGQEPQLLASGTGGLDRVSASRQGKIAWNIWRVNHSIYEIPTNKTGQKSGPTVQLPMAQEGSQRSPSVSHDGKRMSYDSARPDRPNSILIRDFSTGTEHLVDDKGRTSEDGGGETSISPDGLKVLFTRDCPWHDDPNRLSVCSFLFEEGKREVRPICKYCSPKGFSPDGSVALFQKYEQEDVSDNIVSINLQTGKQEAFLVDPEKPLFHAFFSWDGRWVVFKRLNTLQLRYPTAQIFIAPVRQDVAGERSEWIEVTDGRYADDKPQFSPDGNIVYFTSTRDGYLCIWAQRLNTVTKRPVGQPFAYEHFHNASGLSAPMYQPWLSDLSVAREKTVINLPQVQVDMWVADMK